MTFAPLGRADLVRALATESDPDRAEKIVELLGFRRTLPLRQPPPSPVRDEPEPLTPDKNTESPTVMPGPLIPPPFWQADSYVRRSATTRPSAPSVTRPIWRDEPKEPPVLPLLSPWRELLPRLSAIIAMELPTSEVDVEGVVDALSRARQLDPLPRRRHRRPAPQLQVILDRSDRLVPFWDDQDLVAAVLRALVPPHRLSFGLTHESDEEPRLRARNDRLVAYAPPPPGGVVLVLGDLGCLDHGGGEIIDRWRDLGRRIAAAGAIAAALLPAPPSRCPADLRAIWRTAPWERPGAGAGPQDRASLRRRAERLLALASPAVRIEPGFLRAIRRSIDPSEADAGTEADVWQHAAIVSRSPVAASLHPEAQKELRAAFATEPGEIQQRVLALLRHWRHGLAHEIWFEEVLSLPRAVRSRLPRPADVEDARQFFDFLDKEPGAISGSAAAIAGWLDRVGARATDHAWSEPELARAVYAVKQRDRHFVPPPVMDPRDITATTPEQVLEIRQLGRSLIVTGGDNGTGPGEGSLLGIVRSGNGLLRIASSGPARPDAQSFWASGRAPDWAFDWGRDGYGVWASFRVADPSGSPVTQRLRWIAPGQFMMGSPADEAGRYEDEGPRHEVTIAEGFWLFDTACTEALWTAVMGEPARTHRGPDFPVTDVSWEDVQRFCERFNAMMPDLDLSLPSEAQWEYACRAGTQTPYSFGEEISRALANYGRNGAAPVGRLPPNDWGLYEMQGNVWEWCADHWHNTYDGAPADGLAWLELEGGAADRIIRGGSWYDGARDVRAAVRIRYDPASRHAYLGFRCARVQGASPAGEAPGPSAERCPFQGPSAGATNLRYNPRMLSTTVFPRVPRLIIVTDRDELRLGRLTRPEWASAVGRDKFGLYADVTVPAASAGEVIQRMRWIPPGRFMMGSPTDEEGRDDYEGPLDEVTIAEGFWLFATPCTQALWEGVMDDNPSHFKSPTRPVEQVSFDDVERFLDRINDLFPGLDLCLPSEAQWEYACRGGTERATYAGAIRILGENNAAVLDAIAWYGGNSGVGFELENGFDSRYWPEKQYPHERAGTRPVGLKAANPWGLYDMLGNVWEWCADHWHDSYDGAPSDGSAWLEPKGWGAASRVIRGGSWRNVARNVRAACRLPYAPAPRLDYLGFRCARVQDASPAGEARGRAAQGKPAERSEQAAESRAPRRNRESGGRWAR